MPPGLPDPMASRPFPSLALAARAATAALGGPREAALATLLLCHLARRSVGPGALEPEGRADRCAAARQWLGTLALQLPVRAAAGRVLDAIAAGNAGAAGTALLHLATASSETLGMTALDDVRRTVTEITA